jgi:HAD superfamily hydrolase (TIGR01509 family)
MVTKLQSDKHPNIKGILFDMDGVVLDTEKLYTRFWMEASRYQGFPMTKEQALGMRSLGGPQAEDRIRDYFGEKANYHHIRSTRIRMMNAYIRIHGVEPKPGIRELLDHLDKLGIPRAITSSASLETIRSHLGSLGLDTRFTCLCSGKDVPNGKPAPDIYLHGAACLGLAPEECLAIEDSPTGIEAAYRAGCLPVLVPDQDRPGQETLSRCYAVADSLTDLMELL